MALAVAAPTFAGPPAGEGWLDHLGTAVERARSEDKLIVVDLWADWCTWCKKLDAEVFSTDTFRQWAQSYVLLRVDIEDGGDGTRLNEEFAVAGLPTTLILTPDLVRIVQLQGFAPVDTYIQNLELERAVHALLLRDYGEIAEDTASEELKTLADDFHSRRDGPRAADLYRRLLARADDDPEEAAWNRFYYADALRLTGAWAEAAKVAAQARTEALAQDLDEVVELADLLPYHIARDRQDCSKAADELKAYLHAHPDGIYRDTARAALADVRHRHACS